MRDEVLRRDARRAYERGRLGSALRVGIIIAPVALVCAWVIGAPTRTIGLAIILWVTATLLRWRLRQGFEIVSAGLRSGALPLVAALALCRFAPSCPPDLAAALCATAGGLAGGLLGRAVSVVPSVPWQQLLGAATVATLMATLGCLALGIGSAIGAAAGITTAAVIVAAVPRHASA